MSAEGADQRYVKTGPMVVWLGVAVAAAEMALLVGALLVMFAGRLAFVAAALVGLVAVGVLRIGRGDDGLLLRVKLLVFRSETVLRGFAWRESGPGRDDSASSGVREPRRPTGPGPVTARRQQEEARR